MNKDRRLTDVLKTLKSDLASGGSQNPQTEAEWILCHVFCCRRIDLYTDNEIKLDNRKVDLCRELLRKRLDGIPIQYLLGETEFFSLTFYVDNSVLIPRPETETLVEVAIAQLKKWDRGAVIADIGTGSGILAVSIVYNVPQATVYASEISEYALKVAQRNALRNGVAEKIKFLKGDLFQPFVEQGLYSVFDLVVSNPPYVKTEDIAMLPDEIRRYEPLVALDGGPDGLLFYRRIAAESGRFLKEGGLVMMELGDGQAPYVEATLREYRWTAREIIRDLNGTERVIVAERAGRFEKILF